MSKVELGGIGSVTLGGLARVANALGADVDVRLRWRGDGLDRLLDEAHASLVEATVRRLSGLGWTCEVEVSFNLLGERGSIDVLAWHPGAGALLVIEVKSVVPDAQAMIANLDRKARLGPLIGKARGWSPTVVGRLLAIADSTTSRRRVDRFEVLFRTAYPARGPAVLAWLRRPSGPLAGLLFLADSTDGAARRPVAGRQRVNRPRTRQPRPG